MAMHDYIDMLLSEIELKDLEILSLNETIKHLKDELSKAADSGYRNEYFAHDHLASSNS